jgi:hypothetical protein
MVVTGALDDPILADRRNQFWDAADAPVRTIDGATSKSTRTT